MAWAQTDSKAAETDALRRGVAQGAAFCKAHLASAPADLKLGEVEEFCTCMGVHEYAMSGMTDEAKASLRPRQQQMCVEIVRKPGQAAASAPGQAVGPATPPSPPPQTPGAAPLAAAASPVEKIEQWTINTNASGAPVAYARATDSPSVAAFILFCRAKDAIGLRVRYKPGFNEKKLVLPMGGYGIDISTDKNGLVPQASWAAFLKDWLEAEKHTPPEVRRQANYSGVMDIEAQRRIIGKINLDGLTETRERMRSLCAEAITKGAPAGNYLTTGLVAFDPEVLVGAAPTGTPSGVAVVAPSAPAGAPKAAPRCYISEAQIEAQFTREATALRERVKAEFMGTGNLSNRTACANMRRMNAFHQDVIKRVNACEALPSRNKIIAAHRGYIAKNNDSIRRNGWCG